MLQCIIYAKAGPMRKHNFAVQQCYCAYVTIVGGCSSSQAFVVISDSYAPLSGVALARQQNQDRGLRRNPLTAASKAKTLGGGGFD
jgi:hypothetical protein